jgi:hypothetical protein
MSDIVDRLREWSGPAEGDSPTAPLYGPAALMREAAGEIERLRSEVDVLRRYGNKDCTAMADAAIETKRRTGKYPFED